MATKKKKKPFRVNQEVLDTVEQLAAVRLPMEGIATILNTSKSTLERAMKKHEALRDAMDKGRQLASTKARQTLFSRATEKTTHTETTVETVPTGKFDRDGQPIMATRRKTRTYTELPDVGALRFWCQTQEDFKLTEGREHSGPGGRPIEVRPVNEEPKTEAEILAELEKVRAEKKAMEV